MINLKYSAFLGQHIPSSRSHVDASINYLKRQRRRCGVSIRACVAPASLDKLLNTARNELSSNGLEVTSLEWKPRVLTLFVRRQGGGSITADDCANTSDLVGEIIEQGNYLGDVPFTLEVSSPGTAQVLTQGYELDAFRGFPVCVKTTEEIKGNQEFWGTLAACPEGTIRIAAKGRVQKFTREEVEEIRLCTAKEMQRGLT